MKRYIIQKYIQADSASDALKNERKAKVSAVYEDSKPAEMPQYITDAIGFMIEREK